MPMLIYTLITLPPEHLNVISDLRFIERFRWEPKLVGEAAYCLTNLEAAISFLETVDLSTLRSDEAPSGPLKSASSSRPGTPKAETFPPAWSPAVSAPSIASEQLDGSSASGLLNPDPSSSKLKEAQLARNRRISDLVNTPAQALEAASDAMRNTADVGLKTISNSLGDSYKFLLGKLREPAASGEEVVVPKTLEDARKLIGTPPLEDDSSATSLMGPDENEVKGRPPPREDRMLNLIAGGRRPSSAAVRDHSADSSRSAGSSTKRLSAVFGSDDKSALTPTSAPTPTSAIESMRNLGSSFNPMAKLAGGIGNFRPFARTQSQPVTPQPQPQAPPHLPKASGEPEGVDLATVR